MNDSEVDRLKDYLIGLGQRLAELDVRIAGDDRDSRRSLVEAFHAYNGFARILELPEMAVPDDELAEEMSPWINEDEHDGE